LGVVKELFREHISDVLLLNGHLRWVSLLREAPLMIINVVTLVFWIATLTIGWYWATGQ
jgi:hypothetical protein